jgi:hypothetical protein
MSREAMQMALEALENAGEAVYARGGIAAVGSLNIAAQALRKALVDADDTSQKRVDGKAKREQEPAAWMHNFIEGNVITHIPADIGRHPERWTPLYTAPPKREWVELHGSEVPELYKYDVMFMEGWLWAEEKLKEKNHG